MFPRLFRIGLCFAVVLAPMTGCRTLDEVASLPPLETIPANVPTSGESYLSPYEPTGLEDQPQISTPLSPDQVLDYAKIEYLPISLEECIRHALTDSKVFREIGGTIIAAPGAVETTLDPALVYSNPTFGEDAALERI